MRQAVSRLDDSVHYEHSGFLAHAGLQLPGGMPGRFNAAARATAKAAAFWFGCWP
jgi:hypothetical protein